MSELSGPLDNIALVANDTAMVQKELTLLAGQFTTAQGGGGRV
jgi:hypothetical protein